MKSNLFLSRFLRDIQFQHDHACCCWSVNLMKVNEIMYFLHDTSFWSYTYTCGAFPFNAVVSIQKIKKTERIIPNCIQWIKLNDLFFFLSKNQSLFNFGTNISISLFPLRISVRYNLFRFAHPSIMKQQNGGWWLFIIQFLLNAITRRTTTT